MISSFHARSIKDRRARGALPLICVSLAFHTGRVSSSIQQEKEMRSIEERYQRTTDKGRLFDIRFWQSQGDHAIFEAASEMLHDYFLIRGKSVSEFRLQRTVESFQKT